MASHFIGRGRQGLTVLQREAGHDVVLVELQQRFLQLISLRHQEAKALHHVALADACDGDQYMHISVLKLILQVEVTIITSESRGYRGTRGSSLWGRLWSHLTSPWLREAHAAAIQIMHPQLTNNLAAAHKAAELAPRPQIPPRAQHQHVLQRRFCFLLPLTVLFDSCACGRLLWCSSRRGGLDRSC